MEEDIVRRAHEHDVPVLPEVLRARFAPDVTGGLGKDFQVAQDLHHSSVQAVRELDLLGEGIRQPLLAHAETFAALSFFEASGNLCHQ